MRGWLNPFALLAHSEECNADQNFPSSDCVSQHTPRVSRNPAGALKQTSEAGSFVVRSFTNSMPSMSPGPRTSPMTLCLAWPAEARDQGTRKGRTLAASP